REELLAAGHVFGTNSDTEVLLHGFEEWGDELPTKLRGMFAFAIWDIAKKELFLARDHFGIKPLYYAQMGGAFFFASEIKAFLDVPEFRMELNEDILQPFLEFSFVPTTETFFRGVFRLDAGHTLRFRNGKAETVRYYRPEFGAGRPASYEEAVAKVGETMRDSVEHHMIADVEVGSFLSSGIDSSYLVSLARPDKTYTVGYSAEKYNEISYAEDLCEKLSITNRSKIIGEDEFFRVLPKALYHLDEPTSDPAAISLYFVAQMAARDVKVVLSGEGADEFFGGYNYYREEVDLSAYNRIPFPLRRAAAAVAGLLPEGRGLNFIVRRGTRLEDGYIGVNRNFSEKMARRVLRRPCRLRGADVARPVYEAYRGSSNIDKMQAVDIHFWLIKDILLKADRMTMAHSLEGRVPFTDREVFRTAASLPLDWKVTKENTKVALRDAAKAVIPTEAYKKKKLGFPVPIREWIRDEAVRDEIRRAFDTEVSKKYFDNRMIHRLFDEHLAGKKDNYRKVWTIYCFIRWYEVFFGGEAEDVKEERGVL
ncbi:MAG: asparagine synthase (glutamine-hydrolyzing), partial [Lachnospiraceae bacterium]|nr:asparagine synthase (glutamine-hydrolyzing) [Lachnospiraceae bacterium]